MRVTSFGVLALAAGAFAASASVSVRRIPDRPIGVRGGITPISAINANDVSGQSPLEFTIVTIEGVVQQSAGVIDPYDRVGASTFFTVSDGTGSLAIVHPGTLMSPLPQVGQRVQINSVVFTQGAAPLRGLRTLDFDVFGFGTLTNVGSGTPDSPVGVTTTQLQTSGSSFEGKRVRVDGLTIVDPSEWPATGSSGFVSATDGVATIRLFVDDDTNLDGANPPATSFSLLGIVSQDASDFAVEGEHYIYPASVADLLTGDGSGLLSVVPNSVARNATGVALAFTLTGQEATLSTLEIDLPPTWTWSNPGDFALSGTGFASATPSFRIDSGGTTFVVSNAEVTSSDPGTLTVSSLNSAAVLGSSVFSARTATSGGQPAPVTSSPVVTVVAGPSDVVINEVYPTTTLPGPNARGREDAEFIEIHNRTPGTLNVSGWTLSDIGRSFECTREMIWEFPPGAQIPPDGFAVVCRTSFVGSPLGDTGFLAEFPDFPSTGSPLFEMFDPVSDDKDDPSVPNMVLLTPSSASDEIALLGGFITNAGQCESPAVPDRFLPFQERLRLRDVLGVPIDEFAYRETGPCSEDLCVAPGGGTNDSYSYGAPAVRHTLGRDAASTDTDVGRVDILASSQPTPGTANVPGDTMPPGFAEPTVALSSGIVEITFDETVRDETALAPDAYRFVLASGDTVRVRTVFADPELPNRHYFLVTDALPPGTSVLLLVNGVRDLVGPNGGNSLTGSTTIVVPRLGRTICEVQQFDDRGFSPAIGDTVVVAGLVTIGSIEPADGLTAPTDRMSIWVQEPDGCGVNVFAFFPDDSTYATQFASVREFGVQRNDFVAVRGRVTEFVSSTSGAGAVTEIEAISEDPTFYRFLLRGLEGPIPRVVTTKAASDEALEGSLVVTEGVVIAGDERALFVDDGSGSIQVFSNFLPELDLTLFAIGERVRVTGVITQFDSTEPFLSGYELVPQSQAAVERLSGGFAKDGPSLDIERRVLVPELGESIRITTNSPPRADVIVEIYDVQGEKVTTLYDGVGLGPVTYQWNGIGDDGSRVLPGVYICHVRAVALDGGSVESATAPIVVGTRLEGSGVAR